MEIVEITPISEILTEEEVNYYKSELENDLASKDSEEIAFWVAFNMMNNPKYEVSFCSGFILEHRHCFNKIMRIEDGKCWYVDLTSEWIIRRVLDSVIVIIEEFSIDALLKMVNKERMVFNPVFAQINGKKFFVYENGKRKKLKCAEEVYSYNNNIIEYYIKNYYPR